MSVSNSSKYSEFHPSPRMDTEIIKNCHEWFYLSFSKLYFDHSFKSLSIMEKIYQPFRDFRPDFNAKELEIQFFVPEVRAFLDPNQPKGSSMIYINPNEYNQEILFFFKLAWDDLLVSELKQEKPLR